VTTVKKAPTSNRRQLSASALKLLAAIVTALTLLVSAVYSIAEEIKPKRAIVSIIIDDIGYSLHSGQSVIDIPHNLTLAIIPFTPYGKQLATIAHQSQREIMLHAPMETLSTDKWEQSLNTLMGKDEFTTLLQQMLLDIPYVSGLNNHGGSKLTQDRQRMNWLMLSLARHQLYFVDSRTTAETQASTAAAQAAIPHHDRDIFLDNNRDTTAIIKQLDKLLALALREGQAIGIGHPYPETIQALTQKLPEFRQKQVEIVKISALRATPKHRILDRVELSESQRKNIQNDQKTYGN